MAIPQQHSTPASTGVSGLHLHVEPVVKAGSPIGSLKSTDTTSNQQATLARLSQEVQRLEAAGRSLAGQQAAISTGCLAMDACLPANGYLPGSIIEYLRSTSGCGATYLALVAAAAALQASEEKYLVIVDTHHHLYPPALLGHQISLSQVIWVRPQSAADAVWATDQALRTSAVAAVIADIDVVNERDARRFQLAAERGGGLGFLLRSLSARRMPSWAEVQWVVRSLVPGAKHNRLATAGSASSVIGSSSVVGRAAAAWTGARTASDLAASDLAANDLAASDLAANDLAANGRAAQPLRRLEVGLARVRGGKAGAQLQLDIDGARGTLELASRQGNHHEQHSATANTATQSQSAHQASSSSQASHVRVAAQLANSTNSSRRAATG
jgi:hypothetical protein